VRSDAFVSRGEHCHRCRNASRPPSTDRAMPQVMKRKVLDLGSLTSFPEVVFKNEFINRLAIDCEDEPVNIRNSAPFRLEFGYQGFEFWRQNRIAWGAPVFPRPFLSSMISCFKSSSSYFKFNRSLRDNAVSHAMITTRLSHAGQFSSKAEYSSSVRVRFRRVSPSILN
jgi:hypothetical protein